MEKKKEGFKNQKAIILPYDIQMILRKNVMTSLLYVTDIGFYPHALGHYRRRDKGSKQHILIYCYEGEGWYSIDKERNTVKANDFFIIEAGTPHIYGSSHTNPWSIYWFHFTGSLSTLFDSLFNCTTSIDDSPNARYEDRLQLFEEIFQNLEMGYSIENLQYSTICLWHLLGSFRYIPQFREVNKPKATDTIQKVISYMKANLTQRLSLEDLADSVNYSPSYLGTMFTQKTGITPLDYFNHLKIQRACQELDFTDMKVKEIAYELGFSDQYYFSKVFTKYMGITPSEYKKKKKG